MHHDAVSDNSGNYRKSDRHDEETRMLSEHQTEIHTSLDRVLPMMHGLVSICADSLVTQLVVVDYCANS